MAANSTSQQEGDQEVKVSEIAQGSRCLDERVRKSASAITLDTPLARWSSRAITAGKPEGLFRDRRLHRAHASGCDPRSSRFC
jgi:hypothetical protein